ncbi:mas-related G-protein coupled receptor member H-like [Pantherophis guttatus]|uniref:Mas-related G-protein coupled receptor member H-like n=1 Tax=Pantherophis guttatus TaxID=94885 RepID=A0A6P9DI83_PANGU|nr:mas-related G-protein coupled receptor member H-like [Pantherophis guttatus]
MNATIEHFDSNSNNYSKENQTVISSVNLIICCMGLPLNGIVIWLLGFQIKRNPFTVLILNLAISDFGFIIFAAIYSISNFIDPPFQSWVIFYLFDVMYISGLFLLTVISIDRCVAVLFPMWYHCSRPKYLSPVVCALLWLFSFLLVGIGSNHKNLVFSYVPWDLDWIVTAVLCLPLITISTLILFIKICLKSEQVKRGKLLVMILITLLCFLILTLPLYSYLFITLFLGTNYTSLSLQFLLYRNLCACLNSSINPVIYFLVGRKKQAQAKESMKTIFQRVFKEDEVPGIR